MPTLSVSRERADRSSTAAPVERPILIDVSESTRSALVALIEPDGRCCEPDHLERIRRLIDARDVDPALALLVAAVERYGQVYVRID